MVEACCSIQAAVEVGSHLDILAAAELDSLVVEDIQAAGLGNMLAVGWGQDSAFAAVVAIGLGN